MPKKVNLAEILKKNPHVDAKQLSDSMELLEELRSYGVTKRSYELAPPNGGRRAQAVDSTCEPDPRTVHLNRS
jgi:hypothetical protein